MITRRLAVARLWRRFLLSTSDSFGISDLELAPNQRLGTDSFSITETVTYKRTPVEIWAFGDIATHS